ncbi:MAG: DUF547 domain-containing protein [Bacteroidota bacterium]
MKTNIFFLFALFLVSCTATPQESTATDETEATEVMSSEESENPAMAEIPTAVAVNQTVVEAVAETPAPVEASVPQAEKEVTNVQLESTPPSTERPSGPVLTEKKMEAPAPTPPEPVMVEEAPAPKTMPDHGSWDNILRNFVSSSGQVNYSGLKSSKSALEAYLTELQSFPPQSGWSRNQIMAYWINAYNAFTIKLIVDNHPVSSIKNLHGGNPWDQKWIKIGGSTYSLNQIENDILRARYGDARIHFAVNCAAASCPPIHNRAFTADNLNSTLQRLTRRFINNTAYNTISSEEITISKIFEWYAGDFGNVTSYINGFTDVELGEQTKVSYKEYDWALNGK